MLQTAESSDDGSYVSPTAHIYDGVVMELPVYIDDFAEIRPRTHLGAFLRVRVGVLIQSNVTVGRFSAFSRHSQIGVGRHPVDRLSTHTMFFLFDGKPDQFAEHSDFAGANLMETEMFPHTYIGNDVWVGSQASILSGVSVGDGAVIATGAVVTRDVPPYAIVAGVPAKIIRYRFSQDIIDELLKLRWWDFPLKVLRRLNFDDIDECLVKLRMLRAFAKDDAEA